MKNISASSGFLVLTAIMAAFLAACRSTDTDMGGGAHSRPTDPGKRTFVRELVNPPPGDAELPKIKQPAPRSAPVIPPPDTQAAQVPAGYRVEIALSGLQYPGSIEFGEDGTIYVAEAGNIDGGWLAPASVLQFSKENTNGSTGKIVADQLSGPVTDLLL